MADKLAPVVPYIGITKADVEGEQDHVVIYDAAICEHELVMPISRARTFAQSIMELLDSRDL